MKRIFILIFIFLCRYSFSQINPTLLTGFPIILDSIDITYNNGPIIADFNDDKQNEIFVGVNTFSSVGTVFLIDNNGNYFPGFPKYVSCFASYIWIAAGDLNNDGKLDMIIKSDSLYAFDYMGNRIPGFPVFTPIFSNDFGERLALYDLENDGNLEIILSRKNVMTVVNNNGQIRSGWPVTINQGGNTSISYFAIGDVDKDNIAEIIVPSSNHLYQNPGLDSNKIYIFKPNGTQHLISPIISDSGYFFEAYNYPLIFKKDNATYFSILSNYSPTRTPGTFKTRFTTYKSNGSIYTRGNYNSLNYNESMTMLIPETQQPIFLFSELFYTTAVNLNGAVLQNYPIFLQASQFRNLNTGKVNGQWSFIGSKRPDTLGGQGLRGYVQFYNVETAQSISNSMRPIGGPSTAPNLTDLNNDGQLDVIVTTNGVTENGDGCALYAWTITGASYKAENFPWPMYGHDRYRTNQYGFIPPDEPVGIQPVSTNVPQNFQLYQNYPNPFNPSTNIKFDIPESGDVQLTVFDILGREVAVLVNEKLNAGTYNYQFSIDNYQLKSGVYFYKLEAGDFVQTRKMVLIK